MKAIGIVHLIFPPVSPSVKPVQRKTRAELMRDIDADYYGYCDEDDGLIVSSEREAERIGGCLCLHRMLCGLLLDPCPLHHRRR